MSSSPHASTSKSAVRSSLQPIEMNRRRATTARNTRSFKRQKIVDQKRATPPPGDADPEEPDCSMEDNDSEADYDQQGMYTYNAYYNALDEITATMPAFAPIDRYVRVPVTIAAYEPFFGSMYDHYMYIIRGPPPAVYPGITRANFIRVCNMFLKSRADTCARRLSLPLEEHSVRPPGAVDVPLPLALVLNGIGAISHHNASTIVVPTVTEVNVANANDRLARVPVATVAEFMNFCNVVTNMNIVRSAPLSAIADGTAAWTMRVFDDHHDVATGNSSNVYCEAHVTDVTPTDRYHALMVQASINVYPPVLGMRLFRSEIINHALVRRREFFGGRRGVYK